MFNGLKSAALTLICALPSIVQGGTLSVGDGEVLTGTDILAGEFNGQSFTLGEDLVIDINQGGFLDMADVQANSQAVPIDLEGTCININGLGRWIGASGSALSLMNTSVRLHATGLIDTELHFLGDQTHLTIHDGVALEAIEFTDGARMDMFDGDLHKLAIVRSGAALSLHGGFMREGIAVASGGVFNMLGGVVQRNSTVDNDGVVNITGGVFIPSLPTENTRFVTDSIADTGSVNWTVSSAVLDGQMVDLLRGEIRQLDVSGSTFIAATLELTLPDETVQQFVYKNQSDEGFDRFGQSFRFTVQTAEPPCGGDCNRTGTIDFSDLVSILFEFGSNTIGCDADESGSVEFGDLVVALFNFGECLPLDP